MGNGTTQHDRESDLLPKTTSATTAPMPMLAPAPLVCALVVVGRATGDGGSVPPAIAALPHVLQLVSDFLDYATPQFWSISRACDYNHLSLLPRLATRIEESTAEWTSLDDYNHAVEGGRALVGAVRNGNLAMVQWLHAYSPRAFAGKAAEEAAAAGKLELLQWITGSFCGATWSSAFAEKAARYGRVETLRWLWLHKRSASFAESVRLAVLEAAASNGHLEIVQWLHEHHAQQYHAHRHQQRPVAVDKHRYFKALLMAIRCGHLEVAKYLYAQSESRFQVHVEYLRDLIAFSHDNAMNEWLDELSTIQQMQSPTP